MNTATIQKENHRDNVDQRSGKYLTFFLSGEEYGVEILKVQEIIECMPITPVPLASRYILGVINLRGKIHPVMDIKMKFGMGRTQITEESCIIVINASGIMMGILVDKVSEVVNIDSREIDDAPSFGADINTDYLLGIGKAGGRVNLLLDIEKVIATADIINMKMAANVQDQAMTT